MNRIMLKLTRARPREIIAIGCKSNRFLAIKRVAKVSCRDRELWARIRKLLLGDTQK